MTQNKGRDAPRNKNGPEGTRPPSRTTSTTTRKQTSRGAPRREGAREWPAHSELMGEWPENGPPRPGEWPSDSPPPSSPVTTFDAAWEYWLLGWHLLAVQPRTKLPFGRWGGKELAPSPRPEHWKRHPLLNVGIATGPASDVFVLDIDPAKGGLETLRALRAQHGRLPLTPLVRTGSDGWHLYFDFPEGQEVTNSAGKLGPGLDVRGVGGYVVAPPSLHPNGKRYAWHPGRAPSDGVVPPPAPCWLLELVKPPPPRVVVPLGRTDVAEDTKLRRCLAYVSTMPPAISGSGGHDATFAVALQCVGFDLDWDQGMEVLRGFNLGCVPPWSEVELAHKLKQAFESGRMPRGSKL